MPSAIVVAGYGVAFYFLSFDFLNQISVGISYALWSGIEIVSSRPSRGCF